MKLLENLLLVLGTCLAAIGAAGMYNTHRKGWPEKFEELRAEHPAVAARVGEPDPEQKREPHALTAFLGGMALVLTGGALHRLGRPRAGGTGDVVLMQSLGGFHERMDTVLESTRRIAERAAAVSRDEREQEPGRLLAQLQRDLDRLLAEPLFDLTSRHEQFLALVGVQNYARIWDGIATAERLLNRAWSMATDGFREEAVAELPRALQALEQAHAHMEELLRS